MHWLHLIPTVFTAFAASFIEFVEALTVVLAVGMTRGWRSALTGAALALLALGLLVLVFGQSLSKVPLPMVQLVIGTLLLLFGLRWLRKAVLRSAGIIPLHDELAAFTEETASLKQLTPVKTLWDKIALITSFKIVMLEGIEVVFIVIAIGASSQLLLPASIGAIIALLVVAGLGLCLHRPLNRIPENTLKFIIGLLLSAFGCFWVGEGLNISWPTDDGAILPLLFAFFILARILVRWSRKREKAIISKTKSSHKLAQLYRATLKLFVDDNALAFGSLIWIFISGLGLHYLLIPKQAAAPLFFLGFAVIFIYSVIRATVSKR